MMNTDLVTGIVLAGGKSRRMGTDKSVMMLNDKTLIEYAINALKPLCSKVIISSNNFIYDYTGCEVWPDELTGQAPIVGIYSCLKRSATEFNIILSCDTPLTGTELFAFLLQHAEHYDITVPVHNNNLIEPLCGIYKKNAMEILKKYIDLANFRLNECIQADSHQLLFVDERLPFYTPDMFSNINSPEDFENLLTD